MDRRVASVFALGLLTSPAWAGDRAGLDLIGYSPDSRYFAFEEFGIQDGSGSAYSTIYLIDLRSDSWVKGTPIRKLAEGEADALAQVRAEALAEASGKIAALAITTPAELIAVNADGVAESDGQSLGFGIPGYLPGSVNGAYDLTLSTFPAETSEPCGEWFDFAPLGFSLELTAGDTSLFEKVDASPLPRSRGCPSAYRIYGVAIPFMAQEPTDAVALISVYPGGFEGPDRRFIVVPLGQ